MTAQPAYSPKLTILNEAAEHIGANLIDSVDGPQTGAAKVLVARYDQAVREILELRGWSGARKRVNLPSVSIDADLYPGVYGYRLPKDLVRINAVGGGSDPDRYVEQGILYTAIPAPVMIEYNSLDSETYWTPSLVRLMGLNLARRCLYARKESAAAATRLEDLYTKQLRQTSQVEGHRRGAAEVEWEAY